MPSRTSRMIAGTGSTALACSLVIGGAGAAASATEPDLAPPPAGPDRSTTISLEMPEPASVPEAYDRTGAPQGAVDRQARLNVGIGRTVYLYLTRNEQTILASGGAAGLAAMACISLGPAGCIGVSAAVAGAAAYVTIHGFCPSRLEIAIGRGYKCVR